MKKVIVYFIIWALFALSVIGAFIGTNLNMNYKTIYNVSNITADYFIGDGSLLTGVGGSADFTNVAFTNQSNIFQPNITIGDRGIGTIDGAGYLSIYNNGTGNNTFALSLKSQNTDYNAQYIWYNSSDFALGIDNYGYDGTETGGILIDNWGQSNYGALIRTREGNAVPLTIINNGNGNDLVLPNFVLINGTMYLDYYGSLTTTKYIYLGNSTNNLRFSIASTSSTIATTGQPLELKSSDGKTYLNTASVNNILYLKDSAGTNTILTPSGGNLVIGDNLSATYLKGNLSWSYLDDYPVACPAGSAITELGDSVTCTTFGTINYTHLSNFTNDMGFINATSTNNFTEDQLFNKDITLTTENYLNFGGIGFSMREHRDTGLGQDELHIIHKNTTLIEYDNDGLYESLVFYPSHIYFDGTSNCDADNEKLETGVNGILTCGSNPSGGSTGSQYMYFDSGVTSLTTDNTYLGAGLGSATIAYTQRLVLDEMTISDMYCYIDGPPAGDTAFFAVNVDGADIPVNCTATGINNCNATGLSEIVPTNSLINVRFEEIAGITSGHGACTIKYTT